MNEAGAAPDNLPSSATANTSVLIATQGYATVVVGQIPDTTSNYSYNY